VPSDILNTSKYKRRTFTLERGSAGGETEWLINGKPFDPTLDLANPKRNTWEVWEIKNGGGGWVHPMHLHMEEHRILSRNGKAVDYNSNDAENIGREDVVALGPSESVVVARQFRTFTGKYVAHCHNLAHEDHNMMFGWRIEA
jgi:FtsP/CotA-like multicopper oxidase with cupredoxin domain